ncbi:hypothetical protein [Amycolatopsis taiwanensis]|uniref:hypothetical protein n=1 Tax=Amycolatopsis taiwanensis TaxID=342230 RepID=UPI0004B5AECD|nr:hypothetical protein [Amycolatopsis taiwanensis]
MTVRITETPRQSRARRAARWDRAAHAVITAGGWLAVFLIGACFGAAVAVSYLHRLGLA